MVQFQYQKGNPYSRPIEKKLQEQKSHKYKSNRNKINNMIKYAREQFFLSPNELVDSPQRNNSKSYWSLIRKLMKRTSQIYSIPSLYDNDSNKLIYKKMDDDKNKANLLNKYFCSISFVNDTNYVHPDVPSRTVALLSNIYITEQDVKDILQTLKIGKACGDDSITHQMLKSTNRRSGYNTLQQYKQTIRIQIIATA
jgi:hypothetical protein